MKARTIAVLTTFEEVYESCEALNECPRITLYLEDEDDQMIYVARLSTIDHADHANEDTEFVLSLDNITEHFKSTSELANYLIDYMQG